MSLRTRLITDRSALRGLASEWNSLLSASAADTVFLTWEWMSAWLDAVFPDAPLMIVTVRDDDNRLVAIAPFYLTKLRLLGTIPYRCLRILGDSCAGAEYPDIIVRKGCESEAVRRVLRTLMEHRGQWDCIWMPRLAGWTGARERLTGCFAEFGFFCHEREHQFSAVDLPQDHGSYFSALSRNARSMLRRRTKKLFELDAVAFTECRTEAERPAYLDALFELHDRRWSTTGRRGGFARHPAAAAFYRAFTPLALASSWLRIFAIKIGREFKAVQIGYVYGGNFLQLEEGFDPDAPTGIGNVLRSLAIERLVDEGVRCYDFLGEVTEHKRRWLANVRIGCDVFIGRPSLKTNILFARPVWPTGKFLRESGE